MARSQCTPKSTRAKKNPKKVTKKILKQVRQRKGQQGRAMGKAADDKKRSLHRVTGKKRPASRQQQTKRHIVAYTRTSSKTNMHGNSRQRQLAAIRAQAAQDGEDPDGLRIISEVVSGMTPLSGRTRFMGLLEDPNVKVIYVETTSRIARSALVAEQIYQAAERTGTDIVVADNPSIFKRGATPEESLLRRMICEVQEYERDAVVQRLAMGLVAAAMQRGQARGRKSILETLNPNQRQRRRLQTLVRQHDAGRFGYRPLAKKMSQVLQVDGMAMETCRRLCQQLS